MIGRIARIYFSACIISSRQLPIDRFLLRNDLGARPSMPLTFHVEVCYLLNQISGEQVRHGSQLDVTWAVAAQFILFPWNLTLPLLLTVSQPLWAAFHLKSNSLRLVDVRVADTRDDERKRVLVRHQFAMDSLVRSVLSRVQG